METEQQIAEMPNIGRFFQDMATLLKQAEPKYGDFREYAIGEYVPHFKEEVEELLSDIKRLENHSKLNIMPSLVLKDIAKESADVANMAYMIWYQAMRLIGFESLTKDTQM